MHKTKFGIYCTEGMSYTFRDRLRMEWTHGVFRNIPEPVLDYSHGKNDQGSWQQDERWSITVRFGVVNESQIADFNAMWFDQGDSSEDEGDNSDGSDDDNSEVENQASSWEDEALNMLVEGHLWSHGEKLAG